MFRGKLIRTRREDRAKKRGFIEISTSAGKF